jgi:Zincin-like metallopeptidase
MENSAQRNAAHSSATNSSAAYAFSPKRLRKSRSSRLLFPVQCPLCRYRHNGHWSGHKSRLDRDLKSRFNEKAYAAEELIAELTAAFLCAYLGITGELRHAEYIASWISLLKDDDRAIFTASSRASQAADYLRAFSGVEDLP